MHYTDSKFSLKFKSLLTRISPRLNTEVVYFFKFNKRINLKHPRTLDEKIQWLKLNSYLGNPLITQCADKYAVRKYIEQCGCGEILNDLYGVYDNVESIPWDSLPNSFVIKWNFGCGQNLIVHDKSKLNIKEAKKKLQDWYKLHDTFYLPYSEMQYKNIPPKLVCEKLIETEDGELPVDYKLYCFNGKPDCVLVCSKRGKMGNGAEFYFFDKDWNLKRYNKRGMEAPKGFSLPQPDNYKTLFEYATILAKPFPFVRADFYLEKGKVTFGELTFTPCGGFDVNRLASTQIQFGNMVNLEYRG
ncbi:MAG: hypothetical protein IJ665_02430 [Phocaeicola sp.]|nr:hypothetical protein [Phocaeicola sp.]